MPAPQMGNQMGMGMMTHPYAPMWGYPMQGPHQGRGPHPHMYMTSQGGHMPPGFSMQAFQQPVPHP
eukprot:8318876-Pyramimonas_sp.AAC.1